MWKMDFLRPPLSECFHGQARYSRYILRRQHLYHSYTLDQLIDSFPSRNLSQTVQDFFDDSLPRRLDELTDIDLAQIALCRSERQRYRRFLLYNQGNLRSPGERVLVRAKPRLAGWEWCASQLPSNIGTVPGAVATGRRRRERFDGRPVATAPGTVPPRVPMLSGPI